MPIKSTKTTKKSDSKISEKKSTSKVVAKKTTEKKAVVKRRKVDLVPTRASAVAIASQANREKKKALIEKVASNNLSSKQTKSSDTKIPTWVWMFFGCSLLLFCVSFYQAIIRPQIESELVMVNSANNTSVEDIFVQGDTPEIDAKEEYIPEDTPNQVGETETQSINVPETATETIEEFFRRLSNRNFDGAFNLMVPALRNYPDIREHFTSFRMNPFLDGIEGGRLVPTNFEYVVSPTYGKDAYNFDISYVMSSDKQKYEETWEVVVSTSGDEPKIASIRCVTSRCSYHPIFWPENFGLLR